MNCTKFFIRQNIKEASVKVDIHPCGIFQKYIYFITNFYICIYVCVCLFPCLFVCMCLWTHGSSF